MRCCLLDDCRCREHILTIIRENCAYYRRIGLVFCMEVSPQVLALRNFIAFMWFFSLIFVLSIDVLFSNSLLIDSEIKSMKNKESDILIFMFNI